MAGLKITQTGLSDVQRRLQAFGKKYPDEVGRALYLETEVEATEVKRRTPVWNPDRPLPPGHASGSLRNSVHVIGPVKSGDSYYCLIVASAPYAFVVHEDLEAIHKTGQARFIASVLDESRGTILGRVASRVDLSKTKE